MENMIKTLAYAGLGLASEANDKIKERFDELVEAGKEKDSTGKNVIGDFFKTVESSKADFETQIEKMKTKAKDTFPFVKEMSSESDAETLVKEDSVEEAVEV
jgi:polyhydroxyalkanoate synthesis regulator phasin